MGGDGHSLIRLMAHSPGREGHRFYWSTELSD